VFQTPTPYSVPTSSVANPPEAQQTPQPESPPLSLTFMLAAVCCVVALLTGVLGLGAFLAAQKKREDRNETGA
jgi:hypothetical protein